MLGVIECTINFLSYERALALVPPEFRCAYEWFSQMEGQVIPRLPRGADAPVLDSPIKLASQRGMHSPNYSELLSQGAGKKKYILSAHSAGASTRRPAGASTRKPAGASTSTSTGGSATPSSAESVAYEDAELVFHPDGTWTVDYACQTAMPGRRLTDKSNDYMMNNLADGVPVAYLTRCANGYKVHGLAYVKAFNPLAGMFTLHGPVSAENSGVHFYSELAGENLSAQDIATLRGADQFDGEAYTAALIMRRRHQERFRKAVLAAYGGQCAATGVSTPDVLQAAHIDAFAASKSHAVTNGILLRADIHLLYDAHLLTILPETGRIAVSEAVEEETYRRLDGRHIRFPDSRDSHPNNDLLAIHRDCYNVHQRQLGLSCA